MNRCVSLSALRFNQLMVLCVITLTASGSGPFTNTSQAETKESIDLEVAFERSKQCRIIGQYEHDGQVVMPKASDVNQTQNLPIQVRARLDCQQRYTGKGNENQAIRYYNMAKANIRIDDGTKSTELADSNHHIVTRITNQAGQRIQIASLADSLRQTELDLLRNPVDPLTYPQMFSHKKAVEGAKWAADDEALAGFLAVDRIIKNDVQLMLKSVTGDQAKIYLTGKARAEVDDVVTKLEVSGIVMISLKEKMVDTIRLSIRENRGKGQIAPGFTGTTKVSIRVAAAKSVEPLSSTKIKELTAGKSIQRKLKWESLAGHFRLQYDPDWRMIASEKEAAILRLIDDGRLLAQCNIVRLDARPADNPLTLEEFKTEVAKMVSADKSVKLADAKQMRTESGLTALEVTVSGQEEGVPLTWIYHHVSNNDGRRVTFVFTLEEDVSSQVTPAARKLVNSLTFTPKLQRKSVDKETLSKKTVGKKKSTDQAERKQKALR